MKNMKIEINAEQPLDEVVKELERLGYKCVNLGHEDDSWDVFADFDIMAWSNSTTDDDSFEPTTLTDLLAMRDEMFKNKILEQ